MSSGDGSHTFQFHNGSIKRRSPPRRRTSSRTFQFHNGSIKSLWCLRIAVIFVSFNSTMVRLKGCPSRMETALREKFQFHNGSIKSYPVRRRCEPWQSFNSTMVRLKASQIIKEMGGDPGFNSTMVRLKGSSALRSETKKSAFQFHNGSIKS